MKLVVVVYACAGGIFLNPDESRVPQTIRRGLFQKLDLRNWLWRNPNAFLRYFRRGTIKIFQVPQRVACFLEKLALHFFTL
jgi:hypothetical protein